jgi:hypothetical protein
MLSEAPWCGDLNVCRMAFVPTGMGFPTVSGHTQGRGSWQGQSSLREVFQDAAGWVLTGGGLWSGQTPGSRCDRLRVKSYRSKRQQDF